MSAAARASILAAAMALAGLGVCRSAQAQSDSADRMAPAQTQPDKPDAEIVSLTARSIARLGQIDLNRVAEPTEDDFAVSAAMLRIALDLAPQNEHILRLLIEAAGQAGDDDRVNAMTERLIRLDPADTVAQLRLISDRIGRLQDAPSRLAAYDRFLGPRGRSLDASIRSRLALDAALLLREQGDMDGFARRLKQATQLDSTNKDAASLAVTFFTQRVDDAAGRFDLLQNLLMADPFDPKTHLAMARELAGDGAFDGAQRFFATYLDLMNASGRRPPENAVVESYTVQWESRGAEKLLTDLRAEIEKQRETMESRRKALEQAGQSTSDLSKPDDIRLSMGMERLRLAAASALGDKNQIEYARQEFDAGVQRQIDTLTKPDQRPQGMSDEEAAQEVAQVQAEAAWMYLWSGYKVDRAAELIGSFEKTQPIKPDAMARLKGWLALRRGDQSGAEELLKPLAAGDPLARLGLGVLAEVQGRKDDAVKSYTELSRTLAGAVAGAWARTRVALLTGSPPKITSSARHLDDVAAAVPGWLERLIADPHRIMSLEAELPRSHISVLEAPIVRLRLRSIAPIPLGVGPEGPINSRVLLTPGVDAGTEPLRGLRLESVVSMDRRLRLSHEQAIQVDAEPASGILGLMLEELSTRAVRVRWHVIQGFRLSDSGGYLPGPMSLETDTPKLYRDRSPRADADPAALAQWFKTGSDKDVAESLIVLRSQIAQSTKDKPIVTDDDLKTLGEALATRLASSDRLHRLMILGLLPLGSDKPWLAPIDEVLRSETDPDVLLVAILTRARRPDNPLLAAVLADEKSPIAPLARRIRDRLKTMSPPTDAGTNLLDTGK